MLQKLSEHIAGCWARAEDAERRAVQASDATVRADNERLAQSWRHLARSYEFVESLERFLLDAGKWRAAPLPLPQPPCPKCGQGMRLLGIEPTMDDRDLFTFECTTCAHLEVIGDSVK